MLRSIQVMFAVLLAGVIFASIYKGRDINRTEVPGSGLNGPPVSAMPLETRPAGVTKPTPETANARNVGGGIIVAPVVPAGPLERVAALPQPTPPLEPEPDVASGHDGKAVRWRLVFNAVATSAGILQTSDTAIVIPGIDAVSADEDCKAPDGAIWPCGMVARTAFRNYLQGRALNCHLPDKVGDKAIVAECLLQGQDPAAWLVEHGWARTKPDSPFAALAEIAKKSNRGIYGQPPVGVEIILP
jgi:endonuclease YncB( thermonuclease family)